MRTFIFALFFLTSCSSPSGCHGTVPEGNVNLPVGGRACIGGVGYVCTGPNFVEEQQSACSGSDAGRDVSFNPGPQDSGRRG